jgi:hypothetical protein
VNDKDAIDSVTAAMFEAFDNRSGRAEAIDSLYRLFLPEAIVVNASAESVQIYNLKTFVEPRRALLSGGTVADFCEREVSEDTQVAGRIAHRSSRYRKSWTANGERCEGGGVKSLQFVKMPDGWKIASLTWEDE